MRVSNYLKRHRHNPDDFSIKWTKRKNLADRAIEAGDLLTPIRPYLYAAWLAEVKIELEHAGRKAMDGVLKTSRDAQPPNSGETLPEKSDAATPISEKADELENPKLRNIFLKLLLGVAVTKYKFDPNKQGSAVSNIAKTLEELNLRVGDDTIRKYLKQAYIEFGGDLPE